MKYQAKVLLVLGVLMVLGAVAGVIMANNLQTPWPFFYLTLPLSFFAAFVLLAALVFAMIKGPPR